MASRLQKIVRLYTDGFREMTVGRTLWLIILIKLFIMFAILKLFFFRDPMAGMSRDQRNDAVMEQLSDTKNTP